MRFLLPVLAVFTACASSTATIPQAWLSVPQTARIRAVQLGGDGRVIPGEVEDGAPSVMTGIRVDANRIMNAARPLTEPFAAIDSFDLSVERKEVVFSAKRGGNFDVGLVSADGSAISWIPNEPTDEVAVQWAPRGNKVSYFVRGRSADLVRTVHIPTANRLDNDFPYATLRALGWDPQAERYAVAYDSVDASDRVEVMRYGGEERRMAVPPAVRLDVSIEPFAANSLVLRPPQLHYNERLPLIVWITDERNAWDDARGALLQSVRAACVVTTRAPDDAFRAAAKAIPWIDTTRVYLVSSGNGQRATGNEFVVTSDPSLPAGRYRVRGRVVTAPPAVVKSFAAGYIAGQLKGTSSPNGSSR